MSPASAKLKTIYVEDDPAYSKMLQEALAATEQFAFLGDFRTAEEGLAYLQHNEIDLAFIDIELGGAQNGLWLAEQIRDMPLAVVFLTSHTNYAIQAFEACAIDYLVKPVSAGDIAGMMERIRIKHAVPLFSEQIEELHYNYMADQAVPKRIFLSMVGEMIVVQLSDVLYFTSVNRYTNIQMADGAKHLSSKHLKVYIESLSGNTDFVRIHRSSIVNKNYVRSVIRDSKLNQYYVVMANNQKLEMSALKKKEILEELKR
ncbi:LytR/AlgR family response regulator transcription factor [Taibaiella koreensis]|uniref:LytR/AlgR family response regulator transcription factor n=1 Tax=Taibaiella koreensis TaxID=1268548 RepID=UPI0013C2C68A|nr:LytTR family DNA-binding domain-containing protein [Taibaiella koreensis]